MQKTDKLCRSCIQISTLFLTPTKLNLVSCVFDWFIFHLQLNAKDEIRNLLLGS